MVRPYLVPSRKWLAWISRLAGATRSRRVVIPFWNACSTSACSRARCWAAISTALGRLDIACLRWLILFANQVRTRCFTLTLANIHGGDTFEITQWFTNSSVGVIEVVVQLAKLFSIELHTFDTELEQTAHYG